MVSIRFVFQRHRIAFEGKFALLVGIVRYAFFAEYADKYGRYSEYHSAQYGDYEEESCFVDLAVHRIGALQICCIGFRCSRRY